MNLAKFLLGSIVMLTVMPAHASDSYTGMIYEQKTDKLGNTIYRQVKSAITIPIYETTEGPPAEKEPVEKKKLNSGKVKPSSGFTFQEKKGHKLVEILIVKPNGQYFRMDLDDETEDSMERIYEKPMGRGATFTERALVPVVFGGTSVKRVSSAAILKSEMIRRQRKIDIPRIRKQLKREGVGNGN